MAIRSVSDYQKSCVLQGKYSFSISSSFNAFIINGASEVNFSFCSFNPLLTASLLISFLVGIVMVINCTKLLASD